MLDDRLRRAKDRVLAPVAARLRAVPPVTITAVGLAAGLGCAAAAYGGNTSLALGLWAANRTLDGLDGTVARLAGTSSDRGGYVDLVADFITYAAIPVCQVAGAADSGALAVPLGALLGAYYVNAVSWLALSAILERRKSGRASRSGGGGAECELPSALPGEGGGYNLLQRGALGCEGVGFGPPDSESTEAERVPLTTIAMPMGLVEGTETVIFVAACLAWPDGLRPLFVGFAALVMLTAIQRAAWAWRALGPE